MSLRERFERFSDRTSYMVGHPWSLIVSVIGVLTWAISGFWFKFSDTWQLLINTPTTVLTFLLLFVLQASQNRNAKATNLKLDELLKLAAPPEADEAIGAEELPESKLDALHERVKHG